MTEVLERDSVVPLWQQLEQLFYAKIRTGDWQPGHRIPSEVDLNREYAVSRMTVRGVLTRLADEGLLVRVPGRGTFVASTKIEAVSPAYRGVREQLESLGYATTTELISAQLSSPPTNVRELLRLEGDEQVYAIVRLRSADGVAISLHRTFVPAALAPGLDRHDLINEQLCVVLEEHYGLPITEVQEQLEAIAVDGTDASVLGMQPSAPVLLLKDLIFDRAGRPFEYSSVVFRGDKLRLRFDYRR